MFRPMPLPEGAFAHLGSAPASPRRQMRRVAGRRGWRRMAPVLGAGNTTPCRLSTATILVVEDNMLLALDTEEMLRDLGAQQVETACSSAEALRMIHHHAPDFALLDLHLGEETSFGLAHRLLCEGVPFAFASGWSEGIALPQEFSSVAILQKPLVPDALAEQLAAMR